MLTIRVTKFDWMAFFCAVDKMCISFWNKRELFFKCPWFPSIQETLIYRQCLDKSKTVILEMKAISVHVWVKRQKQQPTQVWPKNVDPESDREVAALIEKSWSNIKRSETCNVLKQDSHDTSSRFMNAGEDIRTVLQEKTTSNAVSCLEEQRFVLAKLSDGFSCKTIRVQCIQWFF